MEERIYTHPNSYDTQTRRAYLSPSATQQLVKYHRRLYLHIISQSGRTQTLYQGADTNKPT